MSDCKICTAGFYCPRSGEEQPEGNCTQGYYCPPGQVTSTPNSFRCPIGHYCPASAEEEIRCENGTYQDEEYQWQCKSCPSGTYSLLIPYNRFTL